MKLSNETFAILKNFADINPGIYIRKGQTLKTISPQKSILAKATISETFDSDFGIYDLNSFLSVVSSTSNDVEIEFDNKSAVIISNSGRSRINYRLCSPEMIVVAPEKNINFTDPEVSFTLTESDFNWIKKISSILQSPHVIVRSDGAKIFVSTTDVSNDSAHSESYEICEGNGSTYSIIFRTEYFKFIPGTYTVQISSKGLAYFKNANRDIEYFVTVEQGSTYNK